MYIPKPSESGNYTPPPAGSHTAVCYRFIDLGTQESEWQGEKKQQRKVMLSWELPGELMADGRPFTVNKRYTWSMHEKAQLRHDLESWRGRSFTDSDFGDGGWDIRKILGAPCTLAIKHDLKSGKTYANITSVSPIMKGQAKPEASNLHVYFSLSDFDAGVFEALSDGLKDVIRKSPEYQAIVNGGASSAETERAGNGHPAFDDSIPF